MSNIQIKTLHPGWNMEKEIYEKVLTGHSKGFPHALFYQVGTEKENFASSKKSTVPRLVQDVF